MSAITLDEIVEIQITDGTNTLAIDGSGNIGVTATDLDIRDLVNTQDSIAIGDATNIITVDTLDSAFSDTGNAFILAGVRQDASGSPVSADGDAHPLVFDDMGALKTVSSLSSTVGDDDADGENPIKIGGRGVSGALTALSASSDRYDLLGDLYRRTYVNDSYNIAINTEATTVTSTVAEVLASPLGGRRSVTIQNRGASAVFLVESGATAVTEGIQIPPRSSATFPFGEDIDIFLGTSSGTANVRLLEAG